MDETHIRFGFKGRNQLPLFMVWREYLHDGECLYASVIFNSGNLWKRMRKEPRNG